MCQGGTTCAKVAPHVPRWHHMCSAPHVPSVRTANQAVHPWMLPEKPWSRIHVDHAINFMGYNWLVVIDTYSSTLAFMRLSQSIDLLQQDFAHFGYPHTIVTNNAANYRSEELQVYCKERGIVHPYRPATNRAAERLILTFKQALRKSSKPPKKAVVEFLMQYRRTPTAVGYSPSELLNKDRHPATTSCS